MSRVNILHVTFNMAIGGTEQVIRQLVENLDRRQFFSTIVCIDGSVGEIGVQLQSSGVNIIPLQRKPGFDRALIRNVRRIIEELDIDIVHGHQYTPYIYGWFGARGTRARVFFTEHGRFYPDRYRFKRLLVNPLLSRLTAEVTAISEATRRALARYEFFPLNKIQVIYNGILPVAVDSDKLATLRHDLGFQPADIIVGTVSRLDSIKNQKMMIAAFHRVLQRQPAARLLIVGDGPMRETLEAQVDSLDIGEYVVFAGFKTEPLPYMSLMQVFLLSSFSEGTSMTLLEAMSLSIPCVVTDVGGNPEIVSDGSTGLVVPNDDTERFAGAMLTLLENTALLHAYGSGGHARFHSRFTVKYMVASFSELYQKNANRV